MVTMQVPLLPQSVGALAGSGLAAKNAAEIAEEAFERQDCSLGSGDTAGPCLGVLKEDGLTRVAMEDFAAPGGRKAHVSAFQFDDATGAFSAYTFYRSLVKNPRFATTEGRLSKLASETTNCAEGTLVWAGTVVLYAKGNLNADDLKALEVGLPKMGGRKSMAPLLPTMLPGDVAGTKLQGETLRYAVGPAAYQAMGGTIPAEMLGWDKSVEVATANYAGKAGKGTLTLLLYPTPQIAGDRGRAIAAALGGKALGTVKMRRVGPLVGVTSGDFAPEQAEALVQALQLNEIITYDKPMPLEFHTEVRKTATLLQSIAIFTGVLILAALVIGVFLGGTRAWIRVLRGKPAYSEPEFLTIDLRDKPKALFAPKEPGGPRAG
jgi:hypothetical protein